MANTFLTPGWVTREGLEAFREGQGRATGLRPTLSQPVLDEPIAAVLDESKTSVDVGTVLAVASAAVVLNPQPISRRALFGLALKGR